MTLGLLLLVIVNSRTLKAADLLAPPKIVSHRQSDEKSATAMILQLLDEARGSVSHEHFVFIDTSASQVGTFREQSLRVLESLLKNLPESDRVRLFAIDVVAEPLMSDLAHPQSDATRSAMAQLRVRVPLGATNLQQIVKTALEERPTKTNRSIVYIGDGMSTADLLEDAEMRSISDTLQSHRMPWHSCGIGPQINLQVLSVIAHHTGGYLDCETQIPSTRDEEKSSAIERGIKLANAIQRHVVFPSAIELVSQTKVALPPRPLRSDRETTYVRRGILPIDTKLVVTLNDPKETFEYPLPQAEERRDATFLCVIAEQVENDNGISNSLAGSKMIDVHQRLFDRSIKDALEWGQEQIKRGRPDLANQVARQVIGVVPSNAVAKAMIIAARKLPVKPVSQSVGQNANFAFDDVTQPNKDDSLAREQQQSTQVKTQKLRNQVSNAIEDARKGDPESGLARLKQLEVTIRAAIDINPEDRFQLHKRLNGEIEQLRGLADQRAQQRAQVAEQLAQLQSQQLLAEQADLDEKKLEGLIERVRGLMAEGKHGRDEAYGEAQNVADVAVDLRPGEGTSAATRFDAESAQQLVRSYRLRARRADQFLETLHQVELSHIPFPDEPPVRFPRADVWAALTERRQKWKDIDLRSESPREQRIQKELSAVSEVDFQGVTLREAIDYLKSAHRIEIQVDRKAFEDDGKTEDLQVDLQLGGVTLKSILKLLLEPHQLTYVIEDEVMKITTATAAETKMTTRVYPVADLVVPIQSMGGRMGGGMGGMGMGMGGGVGGGMGMGGGMFRLPPETLQ